MAKNKPAEYKAIAVWHRRTGSFSSYIQRQQEDAADDGAPLDAIYKRESGEWARLSEVQNEELKAEIEAEIS